MPLVPSIFIKYLQLNGALFYSVWFNDSLKPLFNKMVFFHNFCMMLVFFIGSIMICSLIYFWLSNKMHEGVIHSVIVEMVWTLMPAAMLLILSLESLGLLYFIEDGVSYVKYYFTYLSSFNKSGVSKPIKVMGKQWYWSYEYIFKKFDKLLVDSLEYDSYLLRKQELFFGGNRKLESEKPVSMMTGNLTPLNITSGDTLHSFSVTSLGFKMDAIPGRVNTGLLCSQVCGSYFGQCSEICGANHSFMPIEVESMVNFYSL